MTTLPDFLIIGAARSGSTTLFRYLAEHPSVFMATPKEIRYFSSQFDQGIDWYADHFAAARPDQMAGEATPHYLYRPEVMDRIADVVPDARLIAILRDPVERAYSHYWMDIVRGHPDTPFIEHAMTELQLAIGRYVDGLRYATSLFSRDQLLVLFTDDLEQHPQKLYSETCRFLGVDDSFVPDSLGTTVNKYVEFRSMAVRDLTKRAPSWAKPAKRVVSRLNTRTSATYPPMTSEDRSALAREYAPANSELALWLGRDLPPWTQPPDGGRGHD